MSAWHDRVGDLTLFEALTGEAFDRQNGNIAGNFTKLFQKSKMPRGLPGEGMGGFGIDRYIIQVQFWCLETFIVATFFGKFSTNGVHNAR